MSDKITLTAQEVEDAETDGGIVDKIHVIMLRYPRGDTEVTFGNGAKIPPHVDDLAIYGCNARNLVEACRRKGFDIDLDNLPEITIKF